jgi:cytochrome c5
MVLYLEGDPCAVIRPSWNMTAAVPQYFSEIGGFSFPNRCLPLYLPASPGSGVCLWPGATSLIIEIQGVQVSHDDKAFMSTFIGVLVGLVVIAVLFYVAASIVTSDIAHEDHDGRVQAKIEENIKPVGKVNVGTAPASAPAAGAAVAAARSGEEVYNSACLACHSVGVAGAPKLGDSGAWSARAGKGIDTLLSSVVNGLNAMPPKGTCTTCSDDELKAAIEYMLSQSGV